jgi:hypothetical protein
MIISLADVKTLLGITDTTYDTLLNLELPMIQDSILTYLNRKFKQDLCYSASTIAFGANSITDSANGFVDAGLFLGDYIVEGSKYNDGYYTVSVVAVGTLTTAETLTTETAGSTVLITKVNFPKELKLIMAKMAGYTIKNKYGVKSESFSRYSVSYDSNSSYISGYPDSITGGLNKLRRVYIDY